jgi:hypothetical protein
MTRLIHAFRDYAKVPKTHCIFMTKISLLMMCGEMMFVSAVIFRNVNTNYGKVLAVKVGPVAQSV